MFRAASWALALALAVAFTTEGHAQSKKPGDHGQRDPQQMFQKMDANGDGFVTLDEFSQVPRFKDMEKEKVEAAFKRMDANNDGKISLEEFKAAIEKMSEHRKSGGGRKRQPQN